MTMTFLAAARRAACLFAAVALLSACDSGTGGDDDDGGSTGRPTAVAGADQAADVGTPVQLDASASTDPDGDPLTYAWSFVTTPAGSAATLGAASAQTSFTPDVAGPYVARVTVSDGTNTDTDDVTITAVQPSITDLTDDYTADATLPAGVYRVPAGTQIRISGGAALTLSPGVRIDFGAGAGLQANADGAIVANGTAAQPIILQGETTAQGFWDGIAIYSNDPRNVMNYVTVAHGGGTRYSVMDVAANVSLDNDAQLRLSNSTLSQSGAFGLSLDTGASLPAFAANTFSGNTDAPARLNFEAADAVDAASSFASNPDAYVLITDTDARDDVTLVALDVPYRFGNNVAVGDGALLTLSPGVRVQFGAGAGLQANSDGAIAANGTAGQPVDIRGVTEASGSWDGIAIYSNDTRNVISHTTIAHGGGARFSVMDVAANVSLDNGAQLRISNSTLSQSGTFGLSLDTGATLPTFAANTFSGNADAGARVNFEAAGQLDGASSFASNGDAYVLITDTDVRDDITLDALDAPYRFGNNVAVSGGALLTISAGADLLFAAGAGLQANSDGAIRAVGTAAERITFLGEQPQQGYWDGIAVYSNDSRNVFDFVTLSHGGGARFSVMGNAANLAMDNGTQVTITNSSITDSGEWGIQVDPGATLTESGNTFSNNADGDINRD